MSGDIAGSRDHLAVGISPGWMAEHAVCQTRFRIQKFSKDETQRARKKYPTGRLTTWRFAQVGIKPYETLTAENANVLTVAGWSLILNSANLIAGSAASNLFSTTIGRIGVGSGNATGGSSTQNPTVSSTDTTLIGQPGGATNVWYQLCGVAPVLSVAATPCTLVFTASVGAANGNFEWYEFCIDKGTSSGLTVTAPMINHGTTPGSWTPAQALKASGQTWNATATLSFGAATGAGTVG